MKNLLLFFFLIILMLTTNCINETHGEINMVTPEEMESLLKTETVQLVDVRTPKEYKEGHIEFSQNINFKSPTFINDIKKLDKNKPVLVYCQKGSRSAKCAQRMLKAGFKKIYDLEGGFSKWKHDGFKTP